MPVEVCCVNVWAPLDQEGLAAAARGPTRLCALLLGLAGAAILSGCRPAGQPPAPAPGGVPRPSTGEAYEAWARRRFLAAHPGEKPLNWAIGEAVVRFHRSRPMGRFVLHQNDCSDFAECAIDEALGAGARFRRNSPTHRIGQRPDLFDCWYWQPGDATQPGDVVMVAHSPWYAPYDGAISHVGVVGTDGCVYDFVKLRRWRAARYGRNPFEWFVRHSRTPGHVVTGRLKPEYRFRLQPVPAAGP